MSGIEKKTVGLPDKIEDLAEFYHKSSARCDMLMAGIQRYRNMKDISKEKLDEITRVVRDAQEEKIDAEVKLGEWFMRVEKAPGTRTDLRPVTNDGNKLTKEQVAASLGFDMEHDVPRFQTLAENKKIVERVKAEAREADDIPTRTAILKAVKEEKQKAAIEKKEQVPLPSNKYQIIYADPPWKYDNPQGYFGQDVERHYPTMTIEELCALPIRDLADDNCVLYIWSTSPHLEKVFDVIRAWGFQYKTCLVWDKVKHNMGFYASIRHELLLIAGRGSSTPSDASAANQTDSVYVEERTEHSKKPEYFYSMIEKHHPDKKRRIELFARNKRDGWDRWGNEA